jgi:hypothetical protein
LFINKEIKNVINDKTSWINKTPIIMPLLEVFLIKIEININDKIIEILEVIKFNIS